MLHRHVPVRLVTLGLDYDYPLMQSVLVKATMQCEVKMTHHKDVSDQQCGNGLGVRQRRLNKLRAHNIQPGQVTRTRTRYY
jgi:hypothetical protein